MTCSVPVVFIIFRRPDTTARVFEAIRQAQPSKLFVVADGPRNDEEALDCEQARRITETIDWECEVFRNYSNINLGCNRRVSSGLDWVFSHVEEAIILEDDCLPDLSFFYFCKVLLEHYRYDCRIWVISGNNFQDGKWRGDGSYYFSYYNHCWGWATWKRAWKNFNHEINSWPKLKESRLLSSVLSDSAELEYWSNIFERLYIENKPDTWDYRWTYTCWSNSALSILPNQNLVSNIGFGVKSTHTKVTGSPLANLPTQSLKKIVHPSFFIRDRAADQHTFITVFCGGSVKRNRNTINQIKKLIKHYFPKPEVF